MSLYMGLSLTQGVLLPYPKPLLSGLFVLEVPNKL